MVKLHYNWKYTYLRPTKFQVIKRYWVSEKSFAREGPGSAA